MGGPGLAFETWVFRSAIRLLETKWLSRGFALVFGPRILVRRRGTRTDLWNRDGLRARPAVSHISRKTSEMWGTRPMVSGIEFEAVPSFNRDGDGDRVAGRAVGYLNLECDSPGAIWDCPFLQVIPQIRTGSITFQGQTGRDDSWAPSLSQLGTRSAMLRRRRT